MVARRSDSSDVRPSRITFEQRDRLRAATLAGIKRILAAASALHKSAMLDPDRTSGDLLVMAAGLYTYAFEEYGKLLLIEDLEKEGNGVLIPHALFHSHDLKFKKAEKEIPEEFRTLRRPLFNRAKLNQLYDMDLQGATFSGRMLSFYADIDSNGNPTQPPTPDPKFLERAIEHLRLAVAKWEERNGNDISNF